MFLLLTPAGTPARLFQGRGLKLGDWIVLVLFVDGEEYSQLARRITELTGSCRAGLTLHGSDQ